EQGHAGVQGAQYLMVLHFARDEELAPFIAGQTRERSPRARDHADGGDGPVIAREGVADALAVEERLEASSEFGNRGGLIKHEAAALSGVALGRGEELVHV